MSDGNVSGDYGVQVGLRSNGGISSFTMNGGSIEATSRGVLVGAGSSFELNDGSIVSQDQGIQVGEIDTVNYQHTETTFTMNGGKISSVDCSIFLVQNSSVIINEGTIVSDNSCNVSSNGTTRSTSGSSVYYGNDNVTITGGTFIATTAAGYNTGGTYTSGAMNLFINQSGEWNITGGSFYAYDTTTRSKSGFTDYTGGAVNFVVRGGHATFDFDNIVVKQVYKDSTHIPLRRFYIPNYEWVPWSILHSRKLRLCNG